MININKKTIIYFLIALILVFLIVIKTDIFILNFINSFNGITSFNGKGIKGQEHKMEIHLGEKYCKFRGGKMVFHDNEEDQPPVSRCILEYSDSGKTCSGSNDCQGKCILNKSQMGIVETGEYRIPSDKNCVQHKTQLNTFYCKNSNLKGACQSLPDNGCDNEPYWELIENNTILSSWGMCVKP